MSLPLRKKEEHFSYADYLTWPSDERWELIDGEATNMTPAPSRRHQGVAREIGLKIGNFLKDKPCKVYSSPFDVRLFEKEDDTNEQVYTVVQPDIVVICDKKKLDDRGCKGAPDLVIEILSRESITCDMKDKRSLYERYGVREYWIVSPFEQMIMVYRKDENTLYGKPDIYVGEDIVKTEVLEGLEVKVKELFVDEE